MASWKFNEFGCNDEESWKVALRKSRDYICKHIFVLLEVLNKVDSASEVSSAAKQTIMGCSSSYEQNDQFVDWLLTRNEATFNTFLQALLDTNNSHIKEEINRNKQLVNNFQSICSHNKKANNGEPLVSSKANWTNQIGVSQNSPYSTDIFEESFNLPSSSKTLALEKTKTIFPFEDDGKAGPSEYEVEERRRELISLHESVRLQINNAKKHAHIHHKKGFIVVSGGFSDGGYLSKCHVYDIESDSWDTAFQIPNTPGAMWNHSLVNLEGLLCTVGGLDENKQHIKELQIFSVFERRWISFPAMDKISIVRAVYKQPGIIALGRSADRNTKIIQMGLNFAWKDIVEIGRDHWDRVVALDEKIYCFYGLSKVCDKVYDPAKNSWNAMWSPFDLIKEQMNLSPTSYQVLFETRNEAIAFQGCIVQVGIDKLGACKKYNPVYGKAVDLTRLPEPVRRAAIATDGKSIFVVGGETSDGVVDRLQIYDYEDKKWRKGAPCPSKVRSAAAAFLPADALQTRDGIRERFFLPDLTRMDTNPTRPHPTRPEFTRTQIYQKLPEFIRR